MEAYGIRYEFVFIFFLLIFYPLIRAIYNKEDDFKTKILNIILILFLPIIGGIIFLLKELINKSKISQNEQL